jgi:FeS assembly SUF system protein
LRLFPFLPTVARERALTVVPKFVKTDINYEDLLVPYLEGNADSPLEPQVVEALRSVYDPEIPVSVFDLGLIYDLRFPEEGVVLVIMTLTAPTCPVAEEIPEWIKNAIKLVEGVEQVEIDLTWEPFWRPEYMTEAARLELGLM